MWRPFLEEPNGASGEHRPQLDVLIAGQLPPNPGEFVSSRRLASILARLRANYDVVLVDTPPILSVGDALALSAHIDAFMLVSNSAHAPRRTTRVAPHSRLCSLRDPGHSPDRVGLDGHDVGYGGAYYGYGANGWLPRRPRRNRHERQSAER